MFLVTLETLFQDDSNEYFLKTNYNKIRKKQQKNTQPEKYEYVCVDVRAMDMCACMY